MDMNSGLHVRLLYIRPYSTEYTCLNCEAKLLDDYSALIIESQYVSSALGLDQILAS